MPGLYEQHADALALTARLVAARAADIDDHDLLESIERPVRSSVAHTFRAGGGDADVVMAGILAGYVVHARADAGDHDAGLLVRETLSALWSSHLSDRLDAARHLTRLHLDDQPGVRELGTLLRQSPGGQLIAASGHLARRVLHDGGRAGMARAWYGVYGRQLLTARNASRVAAVGLVLAGEPKKAVAEMADISRTTLDKWLTNQDLDRMLGAASDDEVPPL